MKCPTVKVKSANASGYTVINVEDVTDQHVVLDDDLKPIQPDKPVESEKKRK